jgi:hypothetical protein
MTRHRWSSKSRPDPHHTLQSCTRCATVRVVRHEGARHWLEFYDDAGLRIDDGTGRTPG